MALVMDGMISTVDDLRALDSAVLETSTGEGIDLNKKLQVAQDAVHLELSVFLLRARNNNGVTGPGVDLSNVVVTSALRRWHSLRTLAELYSDAYNAQFNDRYLGKWRHYAKQARETSDLLFEYGVGLANVAIPRAAKPELEGTGSGGSITGYYVRTAWRTAHGVSGAASELAALVAANGETLVVRASAPAPAGVVGFDVYVGLSEEKLARQNATPIVPGQAWSVPPPGLIAGPPPPEGQQPDYYVRRNRTL